MEKRDIIFYPGRKTSKKYVKKSHPADYDEFMKSVERFEMGKPIDINRQNGYIMILLGLEEFEKKFGASVKSSRLAKSLGMVSVSTYLKALKRKKMTENPTNLEIALSDKAKDFLRTLRENQ